jgi:hypothetical protein
MAERNAVKPRECWGCAEVFQCTARELRQRQDQCRHLGGSLVLPDCGHEMAAQPKPSFLEVNP